MITYILFGYGHCCVSTHNHKSKRLCRSNLGSVNICSAVVGAAAAAASLFLFFFFFVSFLTWDSSDIIILIKRPPIIFTLREVKPKTLEFEKRNRNWRTFVVFVWITELKNMVGHTLRIWDDCFSKLFIFLLLSFVFVIFNHKCRLLFLRALLDSGVGFFFLWIT